MAQRSPFRPVAGVIIAALFLTIALPSSWKSWAPGFLRNPELHFGLDLAGGTQLDFRISEQEIEQQIERLDAEIVAAQKKGKDSDAVRNLEFQRQVTMNQKEKLMEAVRTVLERRINSLGVSEATITPSYVGSEKHLLVDCPGVVEIQKCIDTVGKTIQLEFKEEFTDVTDDYRRGVDASVTSAQRRITASGESLAVLGEDLGDELGVAYQNARSFFRDQVPKGLESLWNARPGPVVRIAGSVSSPQQQSDGSVLEQDIPGVFLVEVLGPRTSTGRTITEAPVAFAEVAKTQGMAYVPHVDSVLKSTDDQRIPGTLRTMSPGEMRNVPFGPLESHLVFLRKFVPGPEYLSASHILISYKGASKASPDQQRTKEEALSIIQDLKKQIDGGTTFDFLARTYSEGPSADKGGTLGKLDTTTMIPQFRTALMQLKEGQISDAVETEFGYHLLRLDKAARKENDTASYDELTIRGPDAETRANALSEQMLTGNLRRSEEAIPLRFLFFSYQPTGWKDTNLDGTHFRSAAVSLSQTTSTPVVQILFDDEGARMFQELTRKNVGKRIAIFVGGELISAPNVQEEISGGSAIITGSANIEEAQKLAQDLNTGSIPAPIHLSGQRTVEATLGSEALTMSLHAAIVGIVILMIYIMIMYRMLGLVAAGALGLYGCIFFVMLKLPLFLVTRQYIVLTLPGMAGIILSAGLAIDANVLIFERVKEEVRKGKMLRTAIETGFQRSWSSIRDSNVSTLITCAILFSIGTSIVRGFAITLGLGVLMSMFTAVVVTRWILRHLGATKFGEHPEWFVPGAKPLQ
jgi:protein-export membrane protein SecD